MARNNTDDDETPIEDLRSEIEDRPIYKILDYISRKLSQSEDRNVAPVTTPTLEDVLPYPLTTADGTVQNNQHLITESGHNFINNLLNERSDGVSLTDKLYAHSDTTPYVGGSGTRHTIDFPSNFIETSAVLPTDTSPSDYMLKISSEPQKHTQTEIEIWKTVVEDCSARVSGLFAPLLAWGEDGRWVVMQRVTPVAPHHGDLAYESNSQRYYVDEDAPSKLEDELYDAGFTIDDSDENCGVNELTGGLCTFDYGGVSENK